jgi:prepilin signal peptidase PulO-like enzyme (type II secretory pathway)
MAVPFGPFLAGGALVGLAWGPAMLDWYAARLG